MPVRSHRMIWIGCLSCCACVISPAGRLLGSCHWWKVRVEASSGLRFSTQQRPPEPPTSLLLSSPLATAGREVGQRVYRRSLLLSLCLFCFFSDISCFFSCRSIYFCYSYSFGWSRLSLPLYTIPVALHRTSYCYSCHCQVNIPIVLYTPPVSLR
jgi:hypothetical protein